MVDFSNLVALDVRGKTARYILTQMQPGPNGMRPIIIGRPAAQENRAYRDQMLADMGDRLRASGGRIAITSESLDSTRAKARIGYARYVLCGWENVFDVSGQEVPFTGEAAMEFCAKLPDWIFDELRQFFEDMANFSGPLADAGSVAGN